jgi:hypothetical protein
MAPHLHNRIVAANAFTPAVERESPFAAFVAAAAGRNACTGLLGNDLVIGGTAGQRLRRLSDLAQHP